jgi:hypothetical protein
MNQMEMGHFLMMQDQSAEGRPCNSTGQRPVKRREVMNQMGMDHFLMMQDQSAEGRPCNSTGQRPVKRIYKILNIP